MRLLVVDDNHSVAEALERALEATYDVDVCFGGRQAMSLASTIKYDAILLDMDLPDMNGRAVCEELRARLITVPIVVLTGNATTSTKIAMLDMGADDYVTKPFDINELRARLRAVIRRAAQREEAISEPLVVQDLQLDPAKRTVRRKDVDIQLRRKEFDLLEYLMRNSGRTVTRTMIVNNVWNERDEVWTNSVDVHIKCLRDRIDRPFSSKLIRTIHGVGYKLDPAGSAVTT